MNARVRVFFVQRGYVSNVRPDTAVHAAIYACVAIIINSQRCCRMPSLVVFQPRYVEMLHKSMMEQGIGGISM